MIYWHCCVIHVFNASVPEIAVYENKEHINCRLPAVFTAFYAKEVSNITRPILNL